MTQMFHDFSVDLGAPDLSLKIFDNISVIISMEKYDTDTSLSFHLVQAFGTAKDFVNLMTK